MKMVDLGKVIGRLAHEQNKHVFYLQELTVLTGHSPQAVAMALGRLKQEGWVDRLGTLWVNLIQIPTLQEIAFSLKKPSYISFESALYQRGILSQSPKGILSMATTGRSDLIHTPWGKIEFIHLQPKLFVGFDAKRCAYAEKALCDLMYVRIRKGAPPLPGVTLYVSELNPGKLRKLVRLFPKYVQKQVSLL